jgi:GR25 family glycosyltransferase involved in LPS biosynthesis
MVLEDDLVLADGIVECLADGWMPDDADIVKLETRRSRVHVGRERIPVHGARYLSRLKSTNLGGACYVISGRAANRLLQLTTDFADAVDDVLFNVDHPIFSKLTTYQMIPAPGIQGRMGKLTASEETWLNSSIDLSWACGTKVTSTAETGVQRLRRRTVEELKALKMGTRYTFVAHG